MQPPAFPPDERLNPRIDRCVSCPIVPVAMEGTNQVEQREVFVIGVEAKQAYKVIDWMHEVPVNHGGPDWGHVFFGSILPRIQGSYPYIFQEARDEKVQVAIKKLQKNIFIPLLEGENPTRENPFREIHRMQTLVYNEQVILPCIEALEDDNFLYIISPFCEGGDLLRHTPLQPVGGLTTETQAKILYKKMLTAIQFIHDKTHPYGICHRDIKPGNFLVKEDDRVLLADFAMSFPMPDHTELVNHIGTFGTPQYLPPEVAREIPFNARGCDLWAATITLFNVLTGMPVYMRPLPDDILFVYCVMAKSLSDDPQIEMVEEVFRESNTQQCAMMVQISQKVMTFSPELRKLLGHVLALRASDRWRWDDVMNSEWMVD
jgi:serine/threonine protein kinase